MLSCGTSTSSEDIGRRARRQIMLRCGVPGTMIVMRKTAMKRTMRSMDTRIAGDVPEKPSFPRPPNGL
jgi:hypothetical protein